MLNIIWSKNGEALPKEDEVVLQRKEYTKELYKGILQMSLKVRIMWKLMGPLIIREFDTALKELRHKKASGLDEILAEILQASGDKAKDNLY